MEMLHKLDVVAVYTFKADGERYAGGIADGRTDLVFDFLAQGHPHTSKTSDGASLLQWCAYYGDVSAMKFLLTKGEDLQSLGADMGLNAAAFPRGTLVMAP
jgi:hypothetical protein